MADFIHLHTHSEYSLLDGLAKIPDLLRRSQELGMKTLALTDHGGLYGAIKFYLLAKDMGIKPIIGTEVYVAPRSRFDKEVGLDSDQGHLLLLVKSLQGYQNLMKLVTTAHLEGFYYKPRIDFEVLRKYSSELICLSGCLEGEVTHFFRTGEEAKAEKRAKELLEIFGPQGFYLELQKHPRIPDQERVNAKLVDLSQKLGIPLVATNDVHYVWPEDAEAQEVLLCVQTQTTLQTPNRKLSMIDSPDFYLRSPEEMRGLFLDHPEAVENTLKIAEECQLEIPMGGWILPHFPVPEGETPESYLRKLTSERLPQRFPEITSEIKKRIDYELEVICQRGFATYFLIVQDFVNWAKEKGIRVGPGRGSAPGSLVSYVLRITSIDPLVHNLPFERFLNPQRPSPPDIDLDFADDRRDEVIAYVTQKYGKDRVAQIITFGTMEARQAVRDVGRVLGMPYSEPDKIAKAIPFGMTLSQALESVVEVQNFYQEPRHRRLLDLARKLEGVARHASTHAAGVVIADKNLTEYTPLQKEVKGEKIITQYDMYALDLNVSGAGRAIGLLKMDFLGLRNLTILEKSLDYVRKTQEKEIDLSTIPLTDPKVYEMISQGATTGVFQLESAGMRRLAKNLKPRRFSDLAAMVALFRPGPMEWIDEFVAAKNDAKRIKYPHPILKPILEETYGIAVYQEQCLQIAHLMGGYSLEEADILRRAIGKKKREMMEKEKEKFLARAQKKGYSKNVAEKVFALIEKFAGYGFNKSHSTSYALIAYQTAWMKTNFPVEFMAAVLTAETQGASGPIRDEKVSRAIEECRRMGIKILPPDINFSQVGFTLEEMGRELTIRFGLSAIKNVGEAAIETILAACQAAGKFTTLLDFCQRVDLTKVNRKTLESLIKAGALDSFGTRAGQLLVLEKILQELHKEKRQKLLGQASLFEEPPNLPSASPFLPKAQEAEEFTKLELLSFEKQYLGFYLSEHPLAQTLDDLAKAVSLNIQDLWEDNPPGLVTIGGIITQVRKIITRRGNQEMAFVTLGDKTGTCEVVVFPKLYEQTKKIWFRDQAVIVRGRLEEKDEGFTFLAEEAKLFEKTA